VVPLLALPLREPRRAVHHALAQAAGLLIRLSRFADLPHSLPRPAFLADGVALRSDDAARIPPQELIARHADLFDDPQAKELLISPRGLRIVFLAEEADRGRYLIFRDAELAMTPLSPARIAPLLDRLAALRDDLDAWSRQTR
jgi:hypothetical protein